MRVGATVFGAGLLGARLLGAGLLAAAFSAGASHALPLTPLDSDEPIVPSVTRDIFAETELYCLSLGLYFEGGSTGESDIGQRHIARVITERARANRPYWGGKTICGVVFYQRKLCQFSFACLPLARRTPRDNHLWRRSVTLAKEALEGRNPEPDRMARYYMNEKLSNPKHACTFRKEYVPVVQAGTHEFFREAASWERKELAKTNPEACQRYAESLKPKKKAKTKAKNKSKVALAAKTKKKKRVHTAQK